MAPQQLGLLGPTALGHLMRKEIRDEDLILSQVPMMSSHEVQSYFDSFTNNTTKGLQSGSITFGNNLICLHTTNRSGFIAKQALCRSDSSLKHEPNARNLLCDIKMMVSPTPFLVPAAAQIHTSLSANPNQLKTERSEDKLGLCGENWMDNLTFSSLLDVTKIHPSFLRLILAHESSASHIEETELEKPVFTLAPLGSGQTFTLGAPELSVPGVSSEILQRVLSQANKDKV